MRKVEVHMGMPISIDIPNATSDVLFQDLFNICQDSDSRFSPYKTTSELSKLWRGQIKERDASDDMKTIIAECERYEKITEGYFSARFAGSFNPTGYVKAWSIQRMANHLDSKGISIYMINAGGDIVAKGTDSHQWNIAVADPFDTSKPIATIITDNLSVATSGTYERGAHIYDPHTRTPADNLASVTILGPNIITADVLATAVFAMGDKGLDFMKSQENYQTIIVDKDGKIHTTAHTNS